MYKNTSSLKIRLYNEGLKTKQCEECGIVEWNGSEISFELDHINGVNNDNRIENLRILCPNCHSQTKTFRGKNIKKYKIK
jgi:5-methylcytosine-specific restriction endonuclease McrA